MYRLQCRCVPIREVSSFQRVLCTGFNVDVSLLERCPHFTSSHCIFHSSVKKPKSLVEIQQEQQGDPGELTTPTSAGGRGSKGKAYFTFGTPVRGFSCESGIHSSSAYPYTNHIVSYMYNSVLTF